MYGKVRVTNLTDSGQISEAGMAAELLYLSFTGATAGDSITLNNGSGGDAIIGPKTVPANGQLVIGPFEPGHGIPFSEDIYVTVSKTGNACVFARYRERE